MLVGPQVTAVFCFKQTGVFASSKLGFLLQANSVLCSPVCFPFASRLLAILLQRKSKSKVSSKHKINYCAWTDALTALAIKRVPSHLSRRIPPFCGIVIPRTPSLARDGL